MAKEREECWRVELRMLLSVQCPIMTIKSKKIVEPRPINPIPQRDTSWKVKGWAKGLHSEDTPPTKRPIGQAPGWDKALKNGPSNSIIIMITSIKDKGVRYRTHGYMFI